MKMKKVTAMLAALVMVCGITGSVSAGYIDDPDYEDEHVKVEISEFNNKELFSFEAVSEDEHLVLKNSYLDKNVESIDDFRSEYTKYLTLPEGCKNARLGECRAVTGIYVPDTLTQIYIGKRNTDEKLTLIGSKNSIAETYAKQENYDFVLLGDTDNDGKIGATDIVAQMQSLLGDMDFENEILSMAADMNHDGVHNIPDLILTKKAILEGGKGGTLPLGALAAPVYSTSLPPRPASELVKAFTDYVTEYSDDVLLNTKDENKAEADQKNCNKVYSPLSLYMAVSVLAECCEGESEAELLKHLNVEDKEELQKINHDLFNCLYSDKEDTYLKLINSLWIDDKYLSEPFKIKSEKADTLAEKYFVSSFVRDFADQAQCDEITAWIKENTSGKLEPKFEADEDDDEAMKIINTITFKEGWYEEFYGTYKDEFKTADGTIECEFMHDMDTGKLYLDTEFAAYTKKFKDGYQMTFVLPEEDKSTADILKNKETMQNVLTACTAKGADYDEVNAYIPEFSTASKFELARTLHDTGLKRIFDCADLEPVIEGIVTQAPHVPFVDAVTHEAVIDVDKNGCEAAAYTVVAIATGAPAGMTRYNFKCDRPFIYYISDDNGIPFFMGVVNNPTQK